MRKVTLRTVTAFLAKTAYTEGNTHTDGQTLYLHGNPIAEHSHDMQGVIFLRDCGWQTVTTKDRLNGVIELFGNSLGFHGPVIGRAKIGQRKGVWSWGTIPWNPANSSPNILDRSHFERFSGKRDL